MGYILVVIAIAMLILFHEFGHFVVARWCGLPVARFSLGFGPRIWSFKKGDTEYWISAIPLGGYVLLAIEDEQVFFQVPLRRRIAFALGGPAANVLAAIALFAILNIARGCTDAYDILISPFQQTWTMTVQMLGAIGELVAHPDNLSGLIGIVASRGQSVGANLTRLLQFGAMLSLNLAICNLLPIPVLDGGRIVMGLLEKVHPRAIQLLHVPLCILGVVLLLSLMAYATVIDILRLVA